jgi:hypothetical protein
VGGSTVQSDTWPEPIASYFLVEVTSVICLVICYRDFLQ